MVVAVAAFDPAVVRDERDYAGVFEASHLRLVRMAFLLCGDLRRAEDAVAEAFARVYPRWRRGGLDDVDAYLRRAVVNELHSGWRRQRVERRQARRLGGDDRGGVVHADQSADHAALVRALFELNQQQRAAIVLRYYDGLRETDVAEILGIPLGTVKSSVARGLDHLRELLSEEEDD